MAMLSVASLRQQEVAKINKKQDIPDTKQSVCHCYFLIPAYWSGGLTKTDASGLDCEKLPPHNLHIKADPTATIWSDRERMRQ